MSEMGVNTCELSLLLTGKSLLSHSNALLRLFQYTQVPLSTGQDDATAGLFTVSRDKVGVLPRRSYCAMDCRIFLAQTHVVPN